MIVKMICTFDFNPETNKYTPIGSPEIVKDTPKKYQKTDETAKPQIVLLNNKYQLNQAASDLLNVSPGDHIHICYNNLPDNPNVKVPIIGCNKYWHNDLGNKLTKSLTVSYRGVANTVLAEYGSTFTLIPYKEGLFIMQGDKPVEVDDNIEVTETSEIVQDLIEIGEDLAEQDLADIEDDDNYEISDVDFNFDGNNEL